MINSKIIYQRKYALGEWGTFAVLSVLLRVQGRCKGRDECSEAIFSILFA